MTDTSESPFTCASCGKVAVWRRVEITNLPEPSALITFQEDYWWWLEIPCTCGSQKFTIRVDNPRSHCTLYGVGE